ncbi:hypothetical protein H0H81_011091, partial [Sphagnurus paluster]
MLASLRIMGSGREFGWWTQPPCCRDATSYVHGFLLLKEDHLGDIAGWKLPPDHIPWLDFSESSNIKPPLAPPPSNHSWKEYYKWRGLPMESVAALLLHWPLSVYRLLHVLGLTQATARSDERRHLTVYLLGVEIEVNFLPLFGELALLLPNTDLDLILFGPVVAEIVKKAQAHPGCLAVRPFVYIYKAPKVTGAGTLRIELSRAGPLLDGKNLPMLRQERPDAMVALNADLAMPWYLEQWRPLVLASRALGIPFAVTEHSDINARMNMRI